MYLISSCCYSYDCILSLIGLGRFVSADTQCSYEGQWKNGVKHGRGALLLPNGDSFEGEWVDGEVSGPVHYKFADGSPWRDPEY